MKKYERIIKNLHHIDNVHTEAWEESLKHHPDSEEYKILISVQDELDRASLEEFAALEKCIKWYRQRAKTAEDIELVVDLEAEYDRLYEHMVCTLTDEEINEQATGIAMAMIEAAGIDVSGQSADESEAEQNGKYFWKTSMMTNKHKYFDCSQVVCLITDSAEPPTWYNPEADWERVSPEYLANAGNSQQLYRQGGAQIMGWL